LTCRLQHAIRIAFRRGDGGNDSLKYGWRLVDPSSSLRCATPFSVRVKHGKIELVLGGFEVDEEVVLSSSTAADAVRAVNFIQDNDGEQLRCTLLQT